MMDESDLIKVFEPDTLYSEYSVTVRRIGLFNFYYAIELGVLEKVTEKEYVRSIHKLNNEAICS